MQVTETVEITGHLMDTGLLSRVLDDIRGYGGEYTLDKFDLGYDKDDPSTVRMTVGAEDEEAAPAAADADPDQGREPGQSRASRRSPRSPRTASSPTASTRPPTCRPASGCGGHWVQVRNPEMDCGLLVEGG